MIISIIHFIDHSNNDNFFHIDIYIHLFITYIYIISTVNELSTGVLQPMIRHFF